MAHRLGLDAKMYFLSTGTRAAWPATGAPADLTEMGNTRDVTVNLEKGESDVTTRANNGWRALAATLKTASIELEMVYDPEDAAFQKLQTAFFDNSQVALAILDGDKATVGTQGLWADFEVFNFSRAEPLEEALMVNVTLKPAYSTIPPQWVEVAA